ncbi:MAG: hypothetical protein ACI3ZP_01265 [Candidatus Cryptobacteroides sp.]
MTNDYISKTQQAVNFLCSLYHDNMKVVAIIKTMQAEGRTEDLINELCFVRDLSQKFINDLEAM